MRWPPGWGSPRLRGTAPRPPSILAGNRPWPGYAPRATVYAGHQFGRYTRQLGDGRALLIAELDTPAGRDASCSSRAPDRRRMRAASDGRAVLRSSIREYLASEAMHALGVPTTRALSLVGSTLPVQREQVEPAAVVCRVAPSFLRFGHFEYYAHSGPGRAPGGAGPPCDRAPLSHTCWTVADAHERHARWLTEVVERQARLIAMWQTLGFLPRRDEHRQLLHPRPDAGLRALRLHGALSRPPCLQPLGHRRPLCLPRPSPRIGQWNCARLLDACAGLLHDDADAAAERARAIHAALEPAYNAARDAALVRQARPARRRTRATPRWSTACSR